MNIFTVSNGKNRKPNSLSQKKNIELCLLKGKNIQ
jgi:hypothetical protein